MDTKNDEPLTHQIITQLRVCGHFLHYKMGGRVSWRRILIVLSKHDELLQRELQDILGVQSGTLSEMIIGMEKDGLVEKSRSRDDGRQLVLKLTSKGKAQTARCKREYNEQIEKMMSCFSDEQLANLHELLEIMLVNWEKCEGGMDYESHNI